MHRNKRPQIKYHVYSPGGNITALVETGEIGNFPAIAKKIMKADAGVEQVGFLMPPRGKNTEFHLQMMGGEFCGNAARCAALHLSKLKHKAHIDFTGSGFDFPITAAIKGSNVELKLPGEFFRGLEQVNEGYLVDFEGIRFLVTQKNLQRKDFKFLINKYKAGWPAVGVITLKEQKGYCNVEPWVWVSATKTLIAETACASGSLAAATVLRLGSSPQKFYNIRQPSGSMYKVIITGKGDYVSLFSLSGPIKKCYNNW